MTGQRGSTAGPRGYWTASTESCPGGKRLSWASPRARYDIDSAAAMLANAYAR